MLNLAQPATAYADGSALLSIIFEETDGPAIAQRLAQFSNLVSSVLLEAEVRSALFRAGQSYNPNWLSDFEWVYPDRPLGPEIADALQVRYLRSGDLLHVATALYHVRNSGVALAFITLDNNQREVAEGLGFAT